MRHPRPRIEYGINYSRGPEIIKTLDSGLRRNDEMDIKAHFSTSSKIREEHRYFNFSSFALSLSFSLAMRLYTLAASLDSSLAVLDSSS